MRTLTNASLLHAVNELRAMDRDLDAIVARYGAPPMWGRQPGFATLVRIILEQQVSLSAARTMFNRLSTAGGTVQPATIASLGVDGMRSLGFTGQKASYCFGLAQSILTGELDLAHVARAEHDAGRSMLLRVKGLGPWSVDVYFLMALRRPDVWPHGDLALADAVRHVKGLEARPDYNTLTKMAEQWAPWRAVAARILWHHYLSSRGKS